MKTRLKKSSLAVLSAFSLLALSACQDAPQVTKPAVDDIANEAVNTAVKNEAVSSEATVAVSVSNALSSGVNFEHFDQSVRPQDDFYSYVNGGWIKQTEIPADRTTMGAFYDLREQAKADVKAIIDSLATQQGLVQGSDEQKVADMYRAYMDLETLNELGATPLAKEFAAIQALENKDQLAEYFAHSQMIGAGTPFAFYISPDAKNSSSYATHLWQYGLSLPDKDYYFNEDKRFVDIRTAYQAHLEKMFALVGHQAPAQAAKHVFELETAMAEHHWDVVETRNSTKRYNPYQVNELTSLAPNFNWQGYLAKLGADKEKRMIINQPSFVQGVGKVIDETPLNQWQDYMQWQLLTHYASDLSEEIAQENFDFFSTTLNGQLEQQPRWKRGVSTVNAVLGEVVGKVYVKQHFKPEAKARMQDLVENLRSAYGQSIEQLVWMSDETKIQAKDKLAKFVPKIGYPDRWKDYSSLNIDAKDLVGNKIRAAQLEHQRSLAKLGAPIQKWEWFMTPQTVNAYYNPTMNEIVFPAAILQPPFFNMAADDAVNYGGIGAVIGHEMGHGFDDQGAKYDGEGNLKDWWTAKDLEEFTSRGKALIDQYAGYEVFPKAEGHDALHINGELTLGENIGDLAGVTIAYKAYQLSLNGKEAPVIDGLTGDERFFIGFAQIWRAKIKEEALRNRVATDPHSPAKFRAIGALSNMPVFYETFAVKEGDKMFIPETERVQIW